MLNIPEINGLSIDGESNNTVPATSNITATTPTPLVGTTSFPWRTTVKLLIRYGDNFFTCSGATVSSFMVYTAGHCLYSHDPNDDGSTADAQFADEIWAWPAQSDRLFTHREAAEKRDFPYGIAKMAFERTYNAWISNHDYNYDFAWLTLDRRLGDRTGWMGREANVTTASLNYNGYPTETPYVPAGAVFQYPGFDVNNVVSYTPFRIPMDAFVYGGHSGGPVWRVSGGNRFIQGVNSTSNRTGNAEATRVTTDTLNNTTSFIAEDENIRPPVVRPEIIEYELSTTAKDLLTNSVQQGGTIDVKYNAWNIGWQATTVTIDFYLSENDFISTTDHHIGTRTWTINPNNFISPVATLNIPSSQLPGQYHVGWIMTSSVTEYTNDNNTVAIRPEKLTVTSGTTTPPAATLVTPNGTISDTTPTYTWNAVANATYYYLWVNDSTGNKIKTWYTAAAAGCASGTGACSVTPTTTQTSGAGRWWIQTWNPSGSGLWSASMGFTVSSSVPPATTLASPSGAISDTTPAYIWNAVTNATYYYLMGE